MGLSKLISSVIGTLLNYNVPITTSLKIPFNMLLRGYRYSEISTKTKWVSFEKWTCWVFVSVSVSVHVSVSVCDCVPLSGRVLNHLHASACSPPKLLQTVQSLVTCRHHLPDSAEPMKTRRSGDVGTLRQTIIVSLSCYM